MLRFSPKQSFSRGVGAKMPGWGPQAWTWSLEITLVGVVILMGRDLIKGCLKSPDLVVDPMFFFRQSSPSLVSINPAGVVLHLLQNPPF